jgi:hypothetical protein
LPVAVAAAEIVKVVIEIIGPMLTASQKRELAELPLKQTHAELMVSLHGILASLDEPGFDALATHEQFIAYLNDLPQDLLSSIAASTRTAKEVHPVASRRLGRARMKKEPRKRIVGDA